MADTLWFWPAALTVLGLIFGSFIATVVLRWPEEERSPLRGRSQCDGCGKSLSAGELVPLISFLVQRGRCRACGGRISRVHPACEALAMLIGLSAGLAMPGWAGVAGAVFGWLLLTLGALDWRAFWLPDLLTSMLALAGIVAGLCGFAPSLSDRAIGGAAGFAVIWLVAAGYRHLRGRDGLGGGDAKLIGAIGLWLGWRALPLLVLSASLIGLIAVLSAILRGQRMAATTPLPLGTMLALAGYALWLTGAG